MHVPPAILGVFVAGWAAALSGCAAGGRTSFARSIDDACGGERWRQREALCADIRISRADGSVLRGEMLYDVAGNRVVLQGRGSESFGRMGCDGSGVWVDFAPERSTPDWSDTILWASYVAIPFRLIDTNVELTAMPRSAGKGGLAVRISYRGRKRDRVASCALTLGSDSLPIALSPLLPKSPAPASHRDQSTAAGRGLYGLRYTGFSGCDGVRVPASWIVVRHDPDTGTALGPAATVELRHLRFVAPGPTAFNSPFGPNLVDELPDPRSPAPSSASHWSAVVTSRE